MSVENLILMAGLWDEEEIARAATEWVGYTQGAALLRLSPSQFAGLNRCANCASSAVEFREELRRFLERQASREKTHGQWHQLLDVLPPAIEEAAKAATRGGHKYNEAFRNCCRVLRRSGGDESVREVTQRRELAVMHGFLEAIARRYRARKIYGGM